MLAAEKDRNRGPDALVRELSKNIFANGLPAAVRETFQKQQAESVQKGLWKGGPAETNPRDYFAELSMRTGAA